MGDFSTLAAAYALLADGKKQSFEIERFCFKEQIAFIRDPHPFKTAVCSRRAGKTIACAAHLIETATKNPGRVCLYITLSRSNAKRIIWGELLAINRDYGLNGKPNETDLSIKFPNQSVIYCSGASDSTEIEKFRGMAITLCYLDECQSFKPYIATLVDEVIAKALFDYHGTLCLIGTPGPVPAGYFYACATSDQWSHHAWTMFQNPFLEKKSGHTAQETLKRELQRTGLNEDSPTIQRECFGKWKIDPSALVIRYSREKNHFDRFPFEISSSHFIIGVDLGSNGIDRDSDAIAVIGWSDLDKKAYLVHEDIGGSKGITDLAKKIEALITRYNPLKIVMDTGGLGKKIADEICSRHSIPVEAAEKTRKFEYIEILNDALRTESFYAREDSAFASDARILEWERDLEHPGKLKISEKYHSDICFIAGTLIETKEGQIPIEQVCVGDYVKTRSGWKIVEAAAKTADIAPIVELTFSNGSILRCTPSHPIYTKERGFVKADALSYADSVIISSAWKSDAYNLTDGIFTDKKGEGISTDGMEKRKSIFIERYGKNITAPYRADMLSTTRTRIHSTMPWKILSALKLGITAYCIKNTWKKRKKRRRNGTGLKRGVNGTEITPNTGKKKIEHELKALVHIVAIIINMIRLRIMRFFIVQENAGRRREGGQGLMTPFLFAKSVIKNLFEINTVNRSSVAALVASLRQIGFDSVYNLTVADEHEYYANGVLVSNCDAVLYSYREAIHWLYEPQPEKPKKGTPEWVKKQVEELENAAEERLRISQNPDIETISSMAMEDFS